MHLLRVALPRVVGAPSIRGRLGRPVRSGLGTTLLALLLVGVSAAVPVAHAHPNHGLVGDRYVKLVAEDGHLRVVYSLSYGPIGAVLARRSMDGNRDGRLTVAESRAGARSLAKLVRAEARLTLDGSEAELAWQEPFVAPPVGVVDASPITVELSTTVPLDGGETVIVLEDLPGLEGIERSDYAFAAESPAELLGSGAGESATGQERLVSMLDRRVAGRRVVSMRVRMPPRPLGWVALGSFAGGMLVLGALSSLVLRRRARARALASARRTGT